jgi:hypothetical protein
MRYAFAMKTKFWFVSFGAGLLVAASSLRADQLEMQNGDRYNGKVLSVSTDAVVLDSEVLGKITVPRKKVARLAFGTNVIATTKASDAARVVASTNPAAPVAMIVMAKTNMDLSAALRHPGTDTNFIQQIRDQMLAGSPEAASKYDAMVSGLLSGQLNINDLRRQAQSSADQLRALKRELGPDAGDSFDGYLEVLDNFLKEAAAEPANPAAAPQPKSQTH